MPLAEKLIQIVAPHTCISCGAEDAIACLWCREQLFSPIPDRCYRCKKVQDDARTCNSCRKVAPLRHVWVASSYTRGAKEVIRGFKFARKRATAELIAELLDDRLPYLASDVVVTHVPTATTRRRQRGYDQSELIAKSLARRRGLSHQTLLYRLGQERQVGSKRAVRLQQMEGAFACMSPLRAHGVSILLVDDILTTGGTLGAAAKALKNAGAKAIYGAVFAQK